jgi:hypothetical protein
VIIATINKSDGAAVDGVARILSQRWLHEQMINVWGKFYLYHKRGPVALLHDLDDIPNGFALTDPQFISPIWSENQTFNHIRDLLYQSGCLPACE